MQKYFIPTMKKSLHFYFTRFFQQNIKDLKHTWKEITKIVSSVTLIMLFLLLSQLIMQQSIIPLAL